MKLNLFSGLIFVLLISQFYASKLQLIRHNLSPRKNKMINKYISFIQHSEEFKNLRKERESKFTQKLTKLDSPRSSSSFERKGEGELPKVVNYRGKFERSLPPVPERVKKINSVNDTMFQPRPERQERLTKSEKLDLKYEKLNEKLNNKLQAIKDERKETLNQLKEEKKAIQKKLDKIERRNNTKILKEKLYQSGVNFYDDPVYHHPGTVYVNEPFTTYSSVHSVQSQPSYVLREMPIDNSHSLNYYYPYFYKTQILRSYDTLNYANLLSSCSDTNCRWCNRVSGTCEDCQYGFFLYAGRCLTSCQIGLVANNYRRICEPLTTISKYFLLKIAVTDNRPVVYIKAYSTGSCYNMCGRILSDCSCEKSCVLTGRCCSDYNGCDRLVISTSSTNCRHIPNCYLCNTITNQCGQCEPNYYLLNGRCVSNCGLTNVLVFSATNTCYNTQGRNLALIYLDCRVENCSSCVPGNPSVCKQCFNGHFMYNNQCIRMCPVEYRADRATWACVRSPVFAWYWIFPSRSSCQKRCGQVISQDSDCS